MEYRLSWQSFQTWTKESIKDLYQDTDYTDVTLITEDMEVFKSHRIILSSSSDFFKEILGKMKSFQGQTQTLYLKGIHGNILGLLLSFIYLGEVTVSQELIPHFLSTAVDLKIQGNDFEEKTLLLKDLINEDTSNSFDMRRSNLDEIEIKQTEDQIDNGSIPLHNADGDKNSCILPAKDEKRKIQKTSPKIETKKVKTKKLSNHLEVKVKSDSEAEFICIYDTCNDTFKTSTEAKKHIMKTHRKPIKEKKFECETCNKKFQTKHEAQLHWQFKHGNKEKKFSCEICDKKFFQSGDLKMHKKGVHLKIKDFHCTFCDFSFSQHGNLKTHMIKTHTEKYYKYNQLQVKDPSADKI